MAQILVDLLNRFTKILLENIELIVWCFCIVELAMMRTDRPTLFVAKNYDFPTIYIKFIHFLPSNVKIFIYFNILDKNPYKIM